MKTLSIALAALATASVCVASEPSISAKALFFGTDGNVVSVPTAPVNPVVSAAGSKADVGKKVVARNDKTSPLGANYFIRLKKPDGSSQDVKASRVFSSGENFQLGVKVNKPSYVYIFNTDSSGKVTQLYPQHGERNFVDVMGVVFLPSQGSFQFDQNLGDERLNVYLSPKPVPDLLARLGSSKPDLVSDPARLMATADAACASAKPGAQLAMADTGKQLASKGIEFAPATACAGVTTLASKAIVFADDPSPSNGQESSYVVKHQSKLDQTLHLELHLVHR